MHKPKQAQQTGFPAELIRSWEDGDGINFAIALARITGWLLHVDWWTPNQEEQSVDNMKPLRVYVADHSDNIFDVRGKKKLNLFYTYTILPIIEKKGLKGGGVDTRVYAEQDLYTLPLRAKPDEAKIKKAAEAIRHNTGFLAKIPKRTEPYMPAQKAALFTFGRCAIYATALQNLTGLPATAIMAIRFTEQFSYSQTGYAHSVVLHPDGGVEDSWGKQSLAFVLARFGIEAYRLSKEEHQTVNETLQRNSPDKYAEAYEEAVALIKTYILK